MWVTYEGEQGLRPKSLQEWQVGNAQPIQLTLVQSPKNTGKKVPVIEV